jgi:hypothetical protein
MARSVEIETKRLEEAAASAGVNTNTVTIIK